MNRPAALLALLGIAIAFLCGCSAHPRTFDVRDYGAKGDGDRLDTLPLNRAIQACAAAGGGQVRVGPGRYLTGTVHLQSNVTILLDAGAELIGSPDLNQYQSFTPSQGLGAPENPGWHRALILGEGVENVTIAGGGVICGNNVFDPQGEEHVRGPHALLLGNCRNITLRDIEILDASNYAVLLEFTSAVKVRGLKITGGWDGVHLRGWIDHPCRDVSISDCEFYTGDDCIAGLYWQNVRIERCTLNSSCNGIRLFGPAKNVIIHDCLMFGPGRSEFRTAGLLHHTKMAAGLCIQPSSWGDTPGSVDDVHISDVAMRDVATPLHLAAKSSGTIGRVTIDRLSARGVYRAAASIESWGGQPIERVDWRDSTMQFTGGFGPIWSDPAEAAVAFMTAQRDQVSPPGENPRPLPAWGLYARHVKQLNLANVRLKIEKPDARPAIIMEGVELLDVDGLKCPTGTGTTRPIVLKDVRQIRRRGNAVLSP